MASRIMSPACEAFPDRTAEMSTCLWSLASSCTGSAIIALGPNTKKSNRGRVFKLLGSLWPEGFVHSAVSRLTFSSLRVGLSPRPQDRRVASVPPLRRRGQPSMHLRRERGVVGRGADEDVLEHLVIDRPVVTAAQTSLLSASSIACSSDMARPAAQCVASSGDESSRRSIARLR